MCLLRGIFILNNLSTGRNQQQQRKKEKKKGSWQTFNTNENAE